MSGSLRTRLSNALDRHWQKRGWLCWALMPFSLLVQVILSVRRLFYRLFRSSVYRAAVPVVVVGNIYVGGTGKTPAVMAVVDALRSAGWHPGVLSRGYGIRIGKTPQVGQGQLDPTQFGDEPALIAAETGVPVTVHPNRRLAIEHLLARYPETNVIVSDDGLQHLALARDLEIVVQDARGAGNHCVMPAGPLRETIQRLETIDALLTHGPTASFLPKNQAVRQLTMKLEIVQLRHLVSDETLTLSDFNARFAGQPLCAAAGIGSPEKFFTSLRQAGFNLLSVRPLPDHHAFTAASFDKLPSPVILITSKDAIKCKGLNDPRLWVVEVTPNLSDPGFSSWLDQKLRNPTTHQP